MENNILTNSSYLITNNAITSKVGIEASHILSALMNKYNYYVKYNKISENDWFYSTVEDLEADTTLSKYKQKQAIQKLIKENLISYKIESCPVKTRFFCFTSENIQNIENIVNTEQVIFSTEQSKIEQIPVEKLHINQIISIIYIILMISISMKKILTSKILKKMLISID